MKNHWIKKVTLFAIAAIILIFLAGYVVMHLWNWLIPDIFTGANTISYYQALGILVLSKILFGGFKDGGYGNHRGYWRYRFKSKWEGMTEEEREKFRKCYGSCEPGEEATKK